MGKFEPGQSGNPGGRPKTAELRALCKEYTERAVNRLVELLDYAKPRPFSLPPPVNC